MTSTTLAYKPIGITDEVTTCDCCGKTNLKRTVVLERTEDGIFVYFGSQCGAKAIGWTTKDLHKTAKDNQEARRREIKAAFRSHPAQVEHREAIRSHYDNGGDYTTAPLDYWRQLEQKAREAVKAQFNLTDKEANLLII